MLVARRPGVPRGQRRQERQRRCRQGQQAVLVVNHLDIELDAGSDDQRDREKGKLPPIDRPGFTLPDVQQGNCGEEQHRRGGNGGEPCVCRVRPASQQAGAKRGCHGSCFAQAFLLHAEYRDGSTQQEITAPSQEAVSRLVHQRGNLQSGETRGPNATDLSKQPHAHHRRE